jgi:hypothetical protein
MVLVVFSAFLALQNGGVGVFGRTRSTRICSLANSPRFRAIQGLGTLQIELPFRVSTVVL